MRYVLAFTAVSIVLMFALHEARGLARGLQPIAVIVAVGLACGLGLAMVLHWKGKKDD